MLCWLHQWRVSSALDRGAPPGRWSAGHAARCARCAAFRRGAVALERRLRAGVRSAPVPREAAVGGPPPVWPWAAGGIGGLAAAGGVAIVFLLILPDRPGSSGLPPTPVSPPTVAPLPAPVSLTRAASVAERGWLALQERGEAELRREAVGLTADTRSAVAALWAYLPIPAEPTLREPEPQT